MWCLWENKNTYILYLSLSHSVFLVSKNLKWSLAIKFFVWKPKIVFKKNRNKIKNSVSILHYACLHSRLAVFFFRAYERRVALTWNRNFKVSIKKSLKARNKKNKNKRDAKNLNLIYLFGENWLRQKIHVA